MEAEYQDTIITNCEVVQLQWNLKDFNIHLKLHIVHIEGRCCENKINHTLCEKKYSLGHLYVLNPTIKFVNVRCPFIESNGYLSYPTLLSHLLLDSSLLLCVFTQEFYINKYAFVICGIDYTRFALSALVSLLQSSPIMIRILYTQLSCLLEVKGELIVLLRTHVIMEKYLFYTLVTLILLYRVYIWGGNIPQSTWKEFEIVQKYSILLQVKK